MARRTATTRRASCSPRVAAAAVALLLGGGCDRGNSVVPGSSVTNVPYIAVDTVGDPPVRATLARSPWIVLRLGRRGELDLPEPVDAPAVSVLGHSIAHIDVTERRWKALMSMAWGTKRPTWLEPTPVSPDELRLSGIEPPASWVWLTGPEGSCKALLDQPWVALYGGDRGDVLEVSYELRGCEGGPWAPVASLADQLPQDLVFVAAEPSEVQTLGSDAKWGGPLAQWATLPQRVTPNRQSVRSLTVPTEFSSPTQVLYSHLVLDEDDRCQDFDTASTFGWWDDETLALDDPVVDHESPPLLAGAFVRQGEAHALVFRESVFAWVSIPPSEPIDATKADIDGPPVADPGPPQWTRIELPSARWHPDDIAALSYVPPACRE